MPSVDRGAPSTGSNRTWDPPYLQWVVKVSKQCNLRCKYCYEYPFLGDPARMSYDQLAQMFVHIADQFGSSGRRMDFVWHGGEPLLQGKEFYRTVANLEDEILGAKGVAFSNSVQTNLTIVNDDTLELFRDFFTNVGVSIDLFGDQRVNVAGRPVQDRVLRNMQVLRDLDIRFGCITVLSQVTAPHVDAIYRFFEDIDASFRLLPIYRTGFVGQQDTLALSAAEINTAFETVVDHWFASEASISVQPIQTYIAQVVRFLDGGRGSRRYYSKRTAEVVYIVDTDGGLYSNGDAYDPNLCHGNVFTQSFEEMLASAAYDRAVASAEARVSATCLGCRYHGSCSGYIMAESTPEQRWFDHASRLLCGVAQPMQTYIVTALTAAGLVNEDGTELLERRLRAHLGDDPTGVFAG